MSSFANWALKSCDSNLLTIRTLSLAWKFSVTILALRSGLRYGNLFLYVLLMLNIFEYVQIGNSGIFRPEMLLPMGLPEDVSVLAWGLSLERYNIYFLQWYVKFKYVLCFI